MANSSAVAFCAILMATSCSTADTNDHAGSHSTTGDDENSWSECTASTRDHDTGPVLIRSSTWPSGDLDENEYPPLESGTCRVIEIEDTPPGGRIMMSCQRENATHEVDVFVRIERNRLMYLLSEDELELKFQELSPFTLSVILNHMTLRRKNGELVFSNAAFKCVRGSDGNVLEPYEVDGLNPAEWHAPFGTIHLRDGLCPETEPPRDDDGMADGAGEGFLGTERRRAIDITVGPDTIRLFDRTEVADLKLDGGAFDIIAGDIYRVSHPSDDCYGSAASFAILRKD